ncbi:MAG: YjcQ family protein, partial [Finegoldia magna]|nr:YjcQ family protein [Finegoldia magna]
MAKDDYNVIVFKILTYMYAVLKRKTIFDINEFKTAVGNIDENYLSDLLEMMQKENFIEGLIFV